MRDGLADHPGQGRRRWRREGKGFSVPKYAPVDFFPCGRLKGFDCARVFSSKAVAFSRRKSGVEFDSRPNATRPAALEGGIATPDFARRGGKKNLARRAGLGAYFHVNRFLLSRGRRRPRLPATAEATVFG
jgi:hypothetical protein